MQWLTWEDENCHFLIALHSNNILILWNSLTGEKIWDFKFTFSVFKFTIDPIDSSNIACNFYKFYFKYINLYF